MDDVAVNDLPGSPARLQILGGARLLVGRRVITRFPAGKSLQLLVYLALRPNVSHERAFLTDLLWPDAAPETGRARLSVALTFLRGLLEGRDRSGDVFVVDRATICLVPRTVDTDVAAFERAVREAEREATRPATPTALRVRAYADALRLYGGDLLPGLTDEWIEAERVRLAACHDDALAAYSLLTRRPAPRPSSCKSGAVSKSASLLPDVAVETVGSGKAALPPRLTRLVGRDEVLHALRRLGRDAARLVTLVGPGGVGKTHLSLEAAAQDDLPTVWVPLADLPPDAESASVLSAIAAALGLPPGAAGNAVGHALRAVPAIVLLDNAEHVLDGAAGALSELLAAAPRARFLVTSRKPLEISGEQMFPVRPLDLPPQETDDAKAVRESAAVALFVERAQAVRPDFALSDRNASTIARLCHRLDGLPLALELAAARVQTTSIGQILHGLDDLGAALPASSRRGLPSRHRSLSAVLEWSVRLLSPDDKRFFFALSIFRGGWTTEAAEAVTGDLLASDRLAALIAASLVVCEETHGGRVRYRFLETTRDFILRVLDAHEQAALCDRHRNYFAGVAERAFEYWWTGGTPSDVGKINAEEENLLFAMETARSTDPETYLRLSGGAARFIARRQEAAIAHVEQALALAPIADSPTRARALYALHMCHAINGMEERVKESYHEAIAMSRRLNDRRALARYLTFNIASSDAQEEAAAIIEEEGFLPEKAVLRDLQTLTAWRGGDLERAERLFDESLRYHQSRGIGTFGVLTEWGYFLLCRGELLRARPLLDQAVAQLEPEGMDGHSRRIRASVLTGLGAYKAAREDAENVIASRRILAPSFGTAIPRIVAALACVGLGDLDAAQSHARDAMSDLVQVDARYGPADAGVVRAELALARGDVAGALAAAGEAFALLHEQCGFCSFTDAPYWETITCVNARSTLAWAEAHVGLWGAARQGFLDVLRFRHRLGLYNGAFREIEGLAACSVQRGQTARAAHLFAACEVGRLRAGTPPLPHQARDLAARVLPLRSDTVGAPAWREGQSLSFSQAVLVALDAR